MASSFTRPQSFRTLTNISRGDHRISSKDLVGRYYYDRFFNVGSYGGNLLAYRQVLRSVRIMRRFRRCIFSRASAERFPDWLFAYRLNSPAAGEHSDVANFGVPIFQPTIPAIQSISICGYFSRERTLRPSFRERFLFSRRSALDARQAQFRFWRHLRKRPAEYGQCAG